MKRFLFIASVFILGVLGGGALTTVLLGCQIDVLHTENLTLQENLRAMEKQMQQLKAKPQERIVSRVDTYVDFLDKADFDSYKKSDIELAVVQSVEDWLKPLYGQNVAEVNYLLLPNLINREIYIDQTAVVLVLKMAIIAETISVWVEVRPGKERGAG